MKRMSFERARPRLLGAAAVSAALLVPLAVFGAPALARSGAAVAQYQYGPSGHQYKVLICHRTHSKKHGWHLIRVGAPAAKAHLRHGDKLAPPCPPVATTPTVTSPKGHGNGHGNGNGNNGNGNGHGNDHGNSGNSGNNGNNGNGKGKGH
jgi:uncharacterized membrane protein YgcG